MDQLFNSTAENMINAGKRKGYDHVKPDSISFSNYENSDAKSDTSVINLSTAGKQAAGCPTTNLPQNPETTLKTCRQRQMASDIFGLGMDKNWAPTPEQVSVEPAPEEDTVPLNLSPSQEITAESCDSPVANDDQQSIVTEVDAVEATPEIEEPASDIAGDILGEKVVKTGKRHFEGKNESTRLW